MLSFLSQYGYTILIIIALIALFGLLLWSLLREKKAGKSSCCGGCSGCAMAGRCHPEAKPKPADSTAEDTPASAAKGGD